MDWWNALTSGVDLFAKVITPLKQLKDLLWSRPANDPTPASEAQFIQLWQQGPPR